MSPAPEIDEAAVMQLAEMGFPLEACRKAVYYTGNMGPEMAFNWIIAHMEEPGKGTSLNSMEQKCIEINRHTYLDFLRQGLYQNIVNEHQVWIYWKQED